MRLDPDFALARRQGLHRDEIGDCLNINPRAAEAVVRRAHEPAGEGASFKEVFEQLNGSNEKSIGARAREKLHLG